MVYPYNGVWYSHKGQWGRPLWTGMKGFPGYTLKWNERKKQSATEYM